MIVNGAAEYDAIVKYIPAKITIIDKYSNTYTSKSIQTDRFKAKIIKKITCNVYIITYSRIPLKMKVFCNY
jgi:hypothetical protein